MAAHVALLCLPALLAARRSPVALTSCEKDSAASLQPADQANTSPTRLRGQWHPKAVGTQADTAPPPLSVHCGPASYSRPSHALLSQHAGRRGLVLTCIEFDERLTSQSYKRRFYMLCSHLRGP